MDDGGGGRLYPLRRSLRLIKVVLKRRAGASAPLASRARARGAAVAAQGVALKRRAGASAPLASRARARGAAVAAQGVALKRRAGASAPLASRARPTVAKKNGKPRTRLAVTQIDTTLHFIHSGAPLFRWALWM